MRSSDTDGKKSVPHRKQLPVASSACADRASHHQSGAYPNVPDAALMWRTECSYQSLNVTASRPSEAMPPTVLSIASSVQYDFGLGRIRFDHLPEFGKCRVEVIGASAVTKIPMRVRSGVIHLPGFPA